MALASAQVVDAVAALIRTAAGMSTRVHTGRTWPLDESDLPAWRVTAEAEEVEPATVSWPLVERHALEVLAQGYARATSSLDDVLHDLAVAALAKLFLSATTASLSPLNCTMTLRGIHRRMVQEGEAALGRITLELRVEFYTTANAPQTIT